MSRTRDIQGERPSSDPRALWAEALWGVGLLGSVLIFVALIAAIFGRERWRRAYSRPLNRHLTSRVATEYERLAASIAGQYDANRQAELGRLVTEITDIHEELPV